MYCVQWHRQNFEVEGQVSEVQPHSRNWEYATLELRKLRCRSREDAIAEGKKPPMTRGMGSVVSSQRGVGWGSRTFGRRRLGAGI